MALGKLNPVQFRALRQQHGGSQKPPGFLVSPQMKFSIKQLCMTMFVMFGMGLLSANAQVQVETWSAAGGAWTAANQTGWTNGTGGVLNPDASADYGAELSATGATSGGIYSSYYYTSNSTPTFTLSTSNVLSGVQTISLSLTSNAVFSDGSVTLTFGSQSVEVDSFSSTSAGTIGGFAATLYTWTFDVSSLAPENSFSLSWTTPSAHTAYEPISMTQAVPEPSTYALIALGLGALLFVRSRRARA